MPEEENPRWWKNWSLSYLPDVFGGIRGGHTVQEAFYNTVELWFPTYIAEINRQLGADILVVPKHYRFRPEYKTNPREVEADVLVTVPGTVGTPERYNAGFRTNFSVDVMIYIYGGQDWQETQALTYAYGACLRAIAIQQGGLGGVATQTLWDSEEYLETDHKGTRTTGVAHLKFTVTINAQLPYGGPPLNPALVPTGTIVGPNTEPPAPVPVVDTVNVTVDMEADN
jgi:hypothetical protein